MPLIFKEHFQLIVFQELKDWKLERSCMKDNTCLLDHHQRSLWKTISIGLKEMIKSGSTVEHQPVGKLVQESLGEALQAGSSKPTQFPKPIEDRTGKPVTQEIVGKSQGELSSSDRTGEPLKDEEKRVLKDSRSNGETCGRKLAQWRE